MPVYCSSTEFQRREKFGKQVVKLFTTVIFGRLQIKSDEMVSLVTKVLWKIKALFLIYKSIHIKAIIRLLLDETQAYEKLKSKDSMHKVYFN